MKKLLWFEDAFANGCEDKCNTQRLLFYNLMMRWKPTFSLIKKQYWMKKHWEETLRARGIKDDRVMF